MILNKRYLKKITISFESTILEAIKNLNNSGLRIVLVVNKKKKIVGVVNDGDIRRAFSNGFNLKSPIHCIVNKKFFFVKNIFDLNKLSLHSLSNYFHIPIIKNKQIQSLYIHKENSRIKKKKIKEHLVIMAGGFGKRLGVLTKKCPKALLKYNNKPILQYILEHAKKNYFYHIQISVFYLKKMIKDFFLKNNFFSLKINFLEEQYPMGTIGSLGLIKKISNNFILLNCDIISDVDLSELLKFHKTNKATLTIGVKEFKYQNPYGIVVSKKNRFISFKEKPEFYYSINAGIYAFNKKIIPIIRKYKLKNIEDLIMVLNDQNYKILTYPIFENWNDLGQDKKRLKR